MGASASRDSACFAGAAGALQRRSEAPISAMEPVTVTVCGAAGHIGALDEDGEYMVQCEAPKIAKLVYNSNNYMVYGTPSIGIEMAPTTMVIKSTHSGLVTLW